MPRFPIIPRDLDGTICLPDSFLPSFYMEDFTILGFRVGNLDAALRVLEKNGINIMKSPEYSELSVEKRDQIPLLIDLLNSRGISCVVTDIVDRVYQG